MQVTQEMILTAARELDRHTLRDKGWSEHIINEALSEFEGATIANMKRAKIVLVAAVKKATD